MMQGPHPVLHCASLVHWTGKIGHVTPLGSGKNWIPTPMPAASGWAMNDFMACVAESHLTPSIEPDLSNMTNMSSGTFSAVLLVPQPPPMPVPPDRQREGGQGPGQDDQQAHAMARQSGTVVEHRPQGANIGVAVPLRTGRRAELGVGRQQRASAGR